MEKMKKFHDYKIFDKNKIFEIENYLKNIETRKNYGNLLITGKSGIGKKSLIKKILKKKKYKIIKKDHYLIKEKTKEIKRIFFEKKRNNFFDSIYLEFLGFIKCCFFSGFEKKKNKKKIFLVEFPPNEIWFKNKDFLKKKIFEDFFLKEKEFNNLIIICNNDICRSYQIKNFLDFFFTQKTLEIKLNLVTKKNFKKLAESVFLKNGMKLKYKKIFLKHLKNIKNDLNQFWIFFKDFFLDFKNSKKKIKYQNIIRIEKNDNFEKIAFFKKILFNKRLEKKKKLKFLTGKEKHITYQNLKFLQKINNIYFSTKKNIQILKLNSREVLRVIFANNLNFCQNIENLNNFYFFLKKILFLKTERNFFFQKKKNDQILSELIISYYMITNKNPKKKKYNFFK